MNYRDVTVIIPTLNEAKNIGELIGTIGKKCPEVNIVVSDDGSTDGTGQVVATIRKKERKIRLLDRNKSIHGLTASVIDAAKAVKTKFLVVIDGDLQHPPEKISEIVNKLREGNDIVIGTRRKVLGKWPVHRRAMSVTATTLARMKLGSKVKDPMSGFFGTKTVLMKRAIREKGLLFERKGYKVLFELLRAVPEARIAEVRYDFGERQGGQSKIGTRHILLFLRSLLR